MTVWPVGIGIYGMSHRTQKPGFIFSLRSQNCGPKFGLYSQTSCRDEFAGIELNSLPPSPRLLFARISSMYRNRLRKRNLMYCDVVSQNSHRGPEMATELSTRMKLDYSSSILSLRKSPRLFSVPEYTPCSIQLLCKMQSTVLFGIPRTLTR
jgi:hypothetical protein